MFWSFWTANRRNVEQVWKNQTSTCDFGRVKEVLIWYFGWLAKEIMGSLITALIFDLGFIGPNWRQWDCSDGTFYFVSVTMAKSLHNIFCCFWVCLKTASPKSLINSNDYLHRNPTFDPWDSCESLQVQTGKCLWLPFQTFTCFLLSYFASCDARTPVVHAFQRSSSSWFTEEDRTLWKFKMQAHGKGNRLILSGQKPAQQGCQGEEPVCQQWLRLSMDGWQPTQSQATRKEPS